MKLELIGHDEKYALEQSLLTLFPGEKPVYGTVDKTADTRWARVTLTEEDEHVQVTTELGMDGKSAAHSYDYPLSGTEYEKEGQRRHAVGISFFSRRRTASPRPEKWYTLLAEYSAISDRQNTTAAAASEPVTDESNSSRTSSTNSPAPLSTAPMK